MPIAYCFFPKTNQLVLEDIDHLFEGGGVTRGVFRAKGGRTVMPGQHRRQTDRPGLESEKDWRRQGSEGEVVRVENAV